MASDKNESLDSMYLLQLRLLKMADEASDPEQKLTCLKDALAFSQVLIERLALFGAGLDAVGNALRKRVDVLNTTHPDLTRQMDEHLGGLLGVRETFLGIYGEEAEFVRKFERMVRSKMVEQAKLDPNDSTAVMQHLVALGLEAQAAPRATPSRLN